ncbi:MAG: hypothetical protein AAGB48_03125 [Planctomycetota bacterium]
MNSRAKGKRIELELCPHLGRVLGPCRRTAQVDGGLSADIVFEDPRIRLHVEAKGRKRIAALGFLRQAESDAKPGMVPVVVMRENGDTEPVLMLRLSELPGLCQQYANARGTPVYPEIKDGT